MAMQPRKCFRPGIVEGIGFKKEKSGKRDEKGGSLPFMVFGYSLNSFRKVSFSCNN